MSNQESSEEKSALRMLSEVAKQLIDEKRKTRRWRIFFRIVFLSLFVYLFVFKDTTTRTNNLLNPVNRLQKHVALIEINGVIGDEDVSAEYIVASLQSSFQDPKTAAVILRINSPGGSPVHSSNIYNEIVRLKEEYTEIPVYAVIDDICASGGYFIASAANEIYANQASLIGSIGVVSSGFGFTEAMSKIGVSRRLYTAGSNKSFLDPFSAVNHTQVKHWQNTLNKVHDFFIDSVKKGRKDKIKNDPIIFSGMIWSGDDALSYGLIDGYGDCNHVSRNLVSVDNIVNFTKQDNALDQLLKNFKLQIKTFISKEFTTKIVY